MAKGWKKTDKPVIRIIKKILEKKYPEGLNKDHTEKQVDRYHFFISYLKQFS